MPGRVARFRRGAVRRLPRAGLPPRTPITVDVPIVDIAIELVPITVEFTADVLAEPPPIDVTVEVLPVDGAKIVDVPVVDITIEPVAIEAARVFEIPPVDIVHEFPTMTVLNQDADPVEIAVQVLPVDAAKVVDVPPVDITVEPVPVKMGKVVDVPPVDITVEPAGVAVFIMDTRPVEIDVEIMPVTVAFSSDDTAAQRGIPARVISQPTRVYAQNIRTGAWLHTDLEISDLEITHTLSGAQVISGRFPTEIRDLRDAGLESWGTWIHVEENDQITGSGILQPTSVDSGQSLALEAVGVSAYPSGIPYLGTYSGIQIDPADAMRHIWAHLQSYPDGNLGVEVIGTTPVRIGEAEVENVEFTTGAGQDVSFQTGGPYKLDWWEAPDCGSEIADLAKETPFDFVERQFWNNPATKDYVRHQIVIGYPRIGSRRTDLIFAQDENMLAAIGPEETAGTYASQVVLLGKGEGSSIVRGYAGRPVGTRIRRVAVIDAKMVDNTSRANALANEDMERRQALLDITEIVVKARHPNARLGSFQVGDDIPVEGEVPWAGYLRQWERVLSYTYSPDQETIRVACRRSESFNYGGFK